MFADTILHACGEQREPSELLAILRAAYERCLDMKEGKGEQSWKTNLNFLTH